MEGFVRGEVVVLEFPFSNLSQSKRRPCFIIKVPKGEDMIVCQITGISQENSAEIPIKKDDFEKGNLKVDSFLRIDKIFSVEKSLIKYKVGLLKIEKTREIIERVCTFLKN